MPFCAEVAELVDAADSKSAALKSVWVRFPPPAPDLQFKPRLLNYHQFQIIPYL